MARGVQAAPWRGAYRRRLGAGRYRRPWRGAYRQRIGAGATIRAGKKKYCLYTSQDEPDTEKFFRPFYMRIFMNYILQRTTVCTFLFLILPFVVGCDSETEEDSGAPDPISVDIFSIETDLFSDLGGKSSESKFHFLGASIRVWPVSLILIANTIIPIAVSQAALQSTPTFSESVWTWSRSMNADGQSFEFVLTGEPDGANTNWSMFITSDGAYKGETYDNFELFSARVATEAGSGSWQLYYLLDGERVNVLNAFFNRPEAGIKQLTFQIPESASEHGGDSVLYQVDELSRGFLWTQVSAGIVHDVKWNSFTKEGSIKANNHLDGTKGCWNKNFDDVGCSS